MFKGNKIYRIDKKGVKRQIFWVPGVHISFKGRNSEVVISGHLSNISFSRIVCANNCKIFIGASAYRIKKLLILARGDNSFISIGENLSVTHKCEIVTGPESGLSVVIGKDCMFAKNILIRATDGHRVVDLSSGNILNYGKNINIGNHVWLANNVMVLKGVSVSEHSVVSAGSVVTRTCDVPNAVYAGVPSRLVKSDIDWARESP